MSKEFERQLKQAMKSMGSGSIPTTDYSMGETFGQMNLQFPQAPSFTMPKPRELGINRDFSGNKMSLYFQNVEKAKGPDMSKEGVAERNARATDFGRTIGDEMKARRAGAPTRSARKAQQSEYARAYGAPTGNSYEDAYNDAVFKMNRSGAGSPMQDEDTNPAPTPSSPLPTGGDSAQPSGGKQPKQPKTPKVKTPKPSSGGSTPKAPKAPTPQAPQAPTPQAPQAPTPTIPGGGRRSGSRREDAVGDRVRGVKQTTKSTIKPLTKPLTKATTGSSRGATTPDARNPGRRAPKKGRYT